ncbi:MAG: hypothetical protein K2F79_01355, partial [Muribaculaceae bacterium]|nr:hypothetical protein [Muribaculaceae bacterium]
SQEELIEIAKENGWYAEGYGTPLEMVGKLLEHFGIPFHGTVNNNIFNIASELAQGHQLIVGVDANELWDPIGSMGVDEFYGEQANHALTVVGLDTSDPANIMVIVTDPGTGNRQFAYPADQFIDAWQDSDCFMVATDQAPVCPDGSPFLPVEYFGSIPSADVHRLAQADFSVADPSTWHTFVHDLISQNFDLDNLPAYADSLFGNDGTDDNDSINSDDL